MMAVRAYAVLVAALLYFCVSPSDAASCGASCANDHFLLGGKCVKPCKWTEFATAIPCECPNNALIFAPFLREVEGFKIVAYKPEGETAAESGVTIGAGVDMGHHGGKTACRAWLVSIGVKESRVSSEGPTYSALLDRLSDFCGTKGAAARAALAAATTAEKTFPADFVEHITAMVKLDEAKSVETKYNADAGGKKFRDLPCGIRTAIVSVKFQHGQATYGYNFWRQAINSQWEGDDSVLKNLRNFARCYCPRRNMEAGIVSRALKKCPAGSWNPGTPPATTTPSVGYGGPSITGTLEVTMKTGVLPSSYDSGFTQADAYLQFQLGSKKRSTKVIADDDTPDWEDEKYSYTGLKSSDKIYVRAYDDDFPLYDDKFTTYTDTGSENLLYIFAGKESTYWIYLSSDKSKYIKFSTKFIPSTSGTSSGGSYNSGWGDCGPRNPITISKTVGRDGVKDVAAENNPGDVQRVKERLQSLGYQCDYVNYHFWTKKAKPNKEEAAKNDNWDNLGWCIFRFQMSVFNCPNAEKCGSAQVKSPDKLGVIHPDGLTKKWLEASNAPRWIKLDSSGPGWIINDDDPHYHWGTDWLRDVFVSAGNHFYNNFYKARKAAGTPTTLLYGNDASFLYGGGGGPNSRTSEHSSHSAGLSMDLRLAKKDGSYGSTYYTQTEKYDPATAEAHLLALRHTGRTQALYFNDPDMIAKTVTVMGKSIPLSTHSSGHANHYHVLINVPKRCDGPTGSGSPAGSPALDLKGVAGATAVTGTAPGTTSSPSVDTDHSFSLVGASFTPGTGKKPVAGNSFWDCKKNPKKARSPRVDCREFEEGCCDSVDMARIQFFDKEMRVHKDAAGAFAMLASILDKYAYGVQSTHGYCCRCIRNNNGDCTDTMSNHAFGVAIDINPATNPNRFNKQVTLANGTAAQTFGSQVLEDGNSMAVVTDMPQAMVDEIKALKTLTGKTVFRWGGDYTKKKDAMHFELQEDVTPMELYNRFGGYDVNSIQSSSTTPCEQASLVSLGSIKLCAVNESLLTDIEDQRYNDPDGYNLPLFSKFGIGHKPVSTNFKIRELSPAGASYFRFHDTLLECLQLMRTDVKKGLSLYEDHGYVASDERTISISLRLEPDAGRGHRSGMAFDVKYSGASSPKPITLVDSALRVCAPIFKDMQMSMGLGLTSEYVHVELRNSLQTFVVGGAVDHDGNPMSEAAFRRYVMNSGAVYRPPVTALPDCTEVLSTVSVSTGDSYPSSTTAAEVCGSVDDMIQEDDQLAIQQLTSFARENLEPEVDIDEVNGVVTKRLSTRLEVLSGLITRDMSATTSVTMLETWRNKEFNESLEFDNDILHYEARSVRLVPFDTATNTSDLEGLAQLAVCAGFDHVENTGEEIIGSVRKQDGWLADWVAFPDTRLLHSSKPVHVAGGEEEYEDPQAFEHLTPLFDSQHHEKEVLSEAFYPLMLNGTDSDAGFTVSDYLSKELRSNETARYFRLLPELAFCVQRAEDKTAHALKIVTGYRTKSHQESRVEKVWNGVERRHRSGRAVEVTYYDEYLRGNINQTLVLVGALVDRCGAIAQKNDFTIAIGVLDESVYVDFRKGDSGPTIFVSENAGITVEQLTELVEKRLAVTDRLIDPFFQESVCSEIQPQKRSAEYQYGVSASDRRRRSRREIFCSPNDLTIAFCAATAIKRQEAVNKIWKEMEPFLTFQYSLTYDVDDLRHELEDCLLTCDSCDSGSAWDLKVAGCSNFAHHAPLGFGNLVDLGSIHVLEAQNTVEAVACSFLHTCIKGTPLFGAVYGALETSFQPNNDSQVELVYDQANNPSPAVAIIQELFALHVQGIATVYINDMAELHSLKSILRVLMAYNTEVTHVRLILTNFAQEKKVVGLLESMIETWTGTTCPLHSRTHIAEYTIEEGTAPVGDGGDQRRSASSSEDLMESGGSMIDRYHWDYEGLY